MNYAVVRPYERTDQAMNDVDHSGGGMVSLSLGIGSRYETWKSRGQP